MKLNFDWTSFLPGCLWLLQKYRVRNRLTKFPSRIFMGKLISTFCSRNCVQKLPLALFLATLNTASRSFIVNTVTCLLSMTYSGFSNQLWTHNNYEIFNKVVLLLAEMSLHDDIREVTSSWSPIIMSWCRHFSGLRLRAPVVRKAYKVNIMALVVRCHAASKRLAERS